MSFFALEQAQDIASISDKVLSLHLFPRSFYQVQCTLVYVNNLTACNSNSSSPNPHPLKEELHPAAPVDPGVALVGANLHLDRLAQLVKFADEL